MKCPDCGWDNPDNVTRCIHCGADFPVEKELEEPVSALQEDKIPEPVENELMEVPAEPQPPEAGLPVTPPVQQRGEQWWNSLKFVFILTGIGFVLCCCPAFYLAGIILYWANPRASHRDKMLVTVFLILMGILGIAFNTAFWTIMSKTIKELEQVAPPGTFTP